MTVSTEKSNEIMKEELRDIIDKHVAKYGLITYEDYFANGISIGKRIHRNPILEILLNRKYEEMARFGYPEDGEVPFISNSEKISTIIKALGPKIPYSIKIRETFK